MSLVQSPILGLPVQGTTPLEEITNPLSLVKVVAKNDGENSSCVSSSTCKRFGGMKISGTRFSGKVTRLSVQNLRKRPRVENGVAEG